jgi:hypothetical protein
MPFRHPDRSADLIARIEYEVRERLEEAIDHVCLQALVRDRQARGLSPPAADSADDRRRYAANVLTFLRLLQREIGPDEARKASSTPGTADDEQARLIALQVALARKLPDYWQRFETISSGYLTGQPARSGGEGRSLLARLFGGR